MADKDIILWPFPPNWRSGVTERLSWLTDVHISRSGVEQRQSKRLSPRREFEFKVNPVRNIRSYFDQWLHRISDERCLLPLWHDLGVLTASAASGTSAIPVSTDYTEFMAGGLAVLYADAFTFEVVEITAVNSGSIAITTPLAREWPAGANVMPVRKAWLDPEVRHVALSSRVGEATVAFTLDGTNDFVGGAESLTVYQGYPLFTLEPNRQEDLEIQFVHSMEELDGTLGLIRRFDEVGRSFQTQFYNWTATGRAQHYQLRQLLYRLKGRQKAFWMPSFNEDVVLARPLQAGESLVSVGQIGYRALGGPIAGRDRLAIRGDDSVLHPVAINGTSAGLGPGEERLNLSAPVGFTASAGATGSFVSIMRLENDVIEMQHHADSMGTCEIGVACKSFANDRTNAGPFIAPRPAAVKSAGGCGVGA